MKIGLSYLIMTAVFALVGMLVCSPAGSAGVFAGAAAGSVVGGMISLFFWGLSVIGEHQSAVSTAPAEEVKKTDAVNFEKRENTGSKTGNIIKDIFRDGTWYYLWIGIAVMTGVFVLLSSIDNKSSGLRMAERIFRGFISGAITSVIISIPVPILYAVFRFKEKGRKSIKN